MLGNSKRFVAALAASAMVAGVLLLPPAAANAAGATVANGLSTTDLNAVGMSPAALAGDLAGPGVTVSNVTYTGANSQAGRIHVVDPAVVSFNDGVILSSGNIADIAGPNKSDGITGDMAGAADADLDALIANSQTVNPVTFDAASLEFDFVPTASTVYFTYTFGSDEYLEWVNLFNDVFAFYVNGTNCATVPGGPVSIDTINDAVSPNLFRDNSFSAPPANPINIESDGLSVELICSANVNPGQTNHMKLAIADTSDQILDSVVMIKADSLSTVRPESCNDAVDNDDDLLVDMVDPSCSNTTTPATGTGSSGIGSSGGAPAFTGNEGSPITLDAAVIGWTPSADTLTTTWTVTGINGTTGTCEVSPAGKQARLADGGVAVVTAVCPDDGEYVAHVYGWDVENSGSDDTDVDFFVHNAPPSVVIDQPTAGASFDAGVPVDVVATVVDPGVNDTVTCEVSWGDGSSQPGSITAGVCTASHTYTAAGQYIVSVTGTDGAADSAADATLVAVNGAPQGNTPPTSNAGGPYTLPEGVPVALTGLAADADGDPLTTHWAVTAISGGGTCTVAAPNALSTTIICSDNGQASLTLTADDGQAGSSSTAPVTVANVAPTVAIASPAPGATVTKGIAMSVSANVADVATDPLTCMVGWGDGTAVTTGTVSGAGVCNASHTYASTGSKVITVTADDGDGGTTTRTVTVSVAAPAVHTASGSGTVGDMTFTFKVTDTPKSGSLNTKRAVKGYVFVATTVATLTFDGKTATWTGKGTWNGKSGYIYSASAVDNGATGDTFSITVISSATNKTVYTQSGVTMSGGLTVS